MQLALLPPTSKQPPDENPICPAAVSDDRCTKQLNLEGMPCIYVFFLHNFIYCFILY